MYQKKDFQKVWGKNQVLLGWFACLVSFYAKSHEILIETFLNCIDGKKQQNEQRRCGEGLGVKSNHLGLISNFGRFSCQKS